MADNHTSNDQHTSTNPSTHDDHVLPLRGRGLRFVLLNELQQHQTLTIAQMVHIIDQHGYNLNGRASKVISDALRWEQARGRVKRIARGHYTYGHAPQTTTRRIKKFAHQCRAWITATRRGKQPPPTPPTPEHRKTSWKGTPENPLRPPWDHLTWLWHL